MSKGITRTIRLKPEVSEKLGALARNTKRSPSDLANEAIESYVDLNAWQITHIEAALAEDQAGAAGVPHEDVVRWVDSWGSDRELPRPEPKKS